MQVQWVADILSQREGWAAFSIYIGLLIGTCSIHLHVDEGGYVYRNTTQNQYKQETITEMRNYYRCMSEASH